MRRAAQLHAWPLVGVHVAVGGVLGVLLLHPVTMVIYWLEHAPMSAGLAPAWHFALDSLLAAFAPGMRAMTARFATFGVVLGLGSGLVTAAARRHRRQVEHLARLLQRDLATLIRQGEGENLELKASIRWDYRNSCVHRELELPIVRSIAGFLNGGGGTLLIGVSDSGEVLGLEPDLATLRGRSHDAFERLILDLVAQRLGTASCAFVHVLFQRVGDHDVCRVTVEPAPSPVFLRDGHGSHLLVRTGNATRELDAEETLRHVQGR